MSHVTWIWKTHSANAAEVHVHQYLHLVWDDQHNARPKSTAADSKIPQWDFSPCKHPLILPWRVSSSKNKAVAIQQPGLQPGLCGSTRDRGDAMGLSLPCLVIWVWDRGEDLGREKNQAVASYQVRNTWLLHKQIARRAWNGKYYLTEMGIWHTF